jgi:GT2 family glycosyltransferase
LVQLDYPQDRFEVIVVDDGSSTPMSAITAQFQGQLPLRLMRQANAGPASARNAGAAAAEGEYLAFTDDDCQVHADWLTALAATIAAWPNALIGGHTINALPDNIYSSASQLLIDYLYSYYNTTAGKATFFASNNFALPRDLFQQISGFDTNFPLAAGEDREFCDRWRQQGWPMTYASAMTVFHAHPLSLKRYWRQHFNYGRGAYCFHQVRARRGGGQVNIEPLKFYRQLLTYPLVRRGNFQGVSLSGLMVLSQVANTLGFFWERYQQQSAPPPADVAST